MRVCSEYIEKVLSEVIRCEYLSGMVTLSHLSEAADSEKCTAALHDILAILKERGRRYMREMREHESKGDLSHAWSVQMRIEHNDQMIRYATSLLISI